MNNRREMRYENLMEATGKGHKSKALDAAADYYLKMKGNTTAVPTGSVEQLMERAVEQGSVTPREIAELLDSEELRVEYASEWSVGGDDD